jgi:hypothetical protein
VDPEKFQLLPEGGGLLRRHVVVAEDTAGARRFRPG